MKWLKQNTDGLNVNSSRVGIVSSFGLAQGGVSLVKEISAPWACSSTVGKHLSSAKNFWTGWALGKDFPRVQWCLSSELGQVFLSASKDPLPSILMKSHWEKAREKCRAYLQRKEPKLIRGLQENVTEYLILWTLITERAEISGLFEGKNVSQTTSITTSLLSEEKNGKLLPQQFSQRLSQVSEGMEIFQNTVGI